MGQIKKYFILNDRELPLNHRIFNMIIIGFILIAFLSAIQNAFMAFNLLLTLIPLGSAVILFCCLLYVNQAKKNKTLKLKWVSFAILSCTSLVLLPVSWLLNGGVNGAILFYVPIIICSCVFLISNILLNFLVVTTLVVYNFLIYLQFIDPSYVTHYAKINDRYEDISFSFTVCFLCIYGGCYFIYNEYNIARNTTEKLLKEIQLKNKELLYNNKRLIETQKELEQLSLIDSLTSTHNKRSINLAIDSEIGRAILTKQPLSLIMLDLDYFKNINDTFGHIFGDEVLQIVAQIFGESLRSGDLLGRFGGEEFIALLPSCDLDIATKIAQRIQMNLSNTKWREPIAVTVSGGIALYSQDQTRDEFIATADKKLYVAKNNGRNQFIT